MTATKIKSAATRIGHGLLDATTAIHNASLQNQINEIDSESDALRKQLTRLEEDRTKLVERKI